MAYESLFDKWVESKDAAGVSIYRSRGAWPHSSPSLTVRVYAYEYGYGGEPVALDMTAEQLEEFGNLCLEGARVLKEAA